ncbi:hypothetical protein INT48_009892 [Thamnidium elegans]|uniref:Uncharacterized protein n=1 Tax=Thamnidium elegans TaxID=101142 RepID=A0A8H7SJV1_9FUNG|nr:hypothetical protein INT48_009892 [Thamnidium elegans]
MSSLPSPPPSPLDRRRHQIIPRKSLSHHSVRFTTEPPKVYHYTV